MFALKDIRQGTELNFDYQFEIEKEKMECNCGSKYCQGRLN